MLQCSEWASLGGNLSNLSIVFQSIVMPQTGADIFDQYTLRFNSLSIIILCCQKLFEDCSMPIALRFYLPLLENPAPTPHTSVKQWRLVCLMSGAINYFRTVDEGHGSTRGSHPSSPTSPTSQGHWSTISDTSQGSANVIQCHIHGNVHNLTQSVPKDVHG